VILDTSAVVAILLREPGHEALIDALAESARSAIGSPTLAETAIVLDSRLGRDGEAVARDFLGAHEISVLPFGSRHWSEAIRAFRRFGRGRHPARLNFGDCMA
jgi:ribonuclease VapC